MATAPAPVVTEVIGDPALIPFEQMLAIGLAISALGVLPLAELRRRLDFRRRLEPEVLGALVKVAAAIGLAVSGSGVRSLVRAQLAASVITAVGY